jgi:hypothetical protein
MMGDASRNFGQWLKLRKVAELVAYTCRNR